MRTLFFVMLAGATYSYFVYPLLLIALRAVRGRPVMRAGTPTDPGGEASESPAVSLIITAYNEAARIADKLENSLALEYPNLDIVVASDCSDDGTDEIVRRYAARGVRLVRAPERRGKEFAQQCAIGRATGEILVFSDTGTRIEPTAISRLVRYFDDPTVGAISSEDRFLRDDGALVGEGAYVRYEMMLRRLETDLAGLVGLSGSFFAARRAVCDDWDIYSPSDFNTALNCARAGQRAVTAPDVLGYYKDLQDPGREYQRKVRTVLRGITGLMRHADVMSPLRDPLFAWQVFSHKLMRWLVPAFLAGLLITSAGLSGQHWLFSAALAGQIVLYVVAFLAHWRPGMQGNSLVRLVYFFCQVNVAILHAALRYLSGGRMTIWQPSAR
jgi:glycosyltransferase involved in cell wall biosynthesis